MLEARLLKHPEPLLRKCGRISSREQGPYSCSPSYGCLDLEFAPAARNEAFYHPKTEADPLTLTGPRAIRALECHMRGMEGTEYRVMLSGSDRYYVELNRQGELSCTTCDFATQSAAQNWIDQDREREGALDRRWQVASRR